MTGQSNQKRRHTRLDIELKAVLGYEGGVECSVLTDNLSFSGARFSLMVPIEPTQADVLPSSELSDAPLQSAGPEVAALEASIEAGLPHLKKRPILSLRCSPTVQWCAHPKHCLWWCVRMRWASPTTRSLMMRNGRRHRNSRYRISTRSRSSRRSSNPNPACRLAETQELEVPDTAEIDALVEQVEVEDAQAEASDATRTESDNTRDTHDAALAPTLEVEAEAFEREPSAPKLEPVDGAEPLDAAPPESPEGVTDESEPPSAPGLEPELEMDAAEPDVPEVEPAPEVPKKKVVLPDDILEWVDLYLPNADEPIRLSVREIRRIDEAVMVEFVDSTFTEYTLYKNFLIQRGLESGSDLTVEFDANPHLAENFELEFNNRKLGQILEILYGLTSREVKTAIAEQRQSGRRLGDILIKWGRITKQQLQAAIAVSKSGQDTLFSQFFLKVLPTDIWQRFWQLFGEGTTMVLVTLGVMVGLGGIPQGGLISIFLVSTALTSRIESILQHQDGRQRGRELLGLFLGLFIGYAAVSILFNSTMIFRMFEVLLNSNGVTNTETLFDRKFHSLLPIMANNLMVLISGCILSFCFRQYGVLLTLVWNACLWGVSLVTLVTQTLDRIQSDLALKVLASTASLMPHLAIEALGYIYAASAAHGISKAVMWGAGARAQQRRAITKYMVQIILEAVLIILGACLESYWVPWSMRTIMLGYGA